MRLNIIMQLGFIGHSRWWFVSAAVIVGIGFSGLAVCLTVICCGAVCLYRLCFVLNLLDELCLLLIRKLFLSPRSLTA